MGRQSRRREKRNSIKSIKEYVYIDETEMNSVLAQLKDGIPRVISSVNQMSNEEAIENSKSNTGSVDSGFNIGIKGKVGYQKQNNSGTSSTESRMSQTAIETVYNDYAINIIEEELKKAELLKESANLSAGSFVKLTQKFSISDFNLMKQFTGNTSIANLIEDESDKDGFNTFRDSAIALQGLFPDTIFVKLNSSLILGNENDFRYSKPQLEATNFSDRKITVIGRVESVLTKEVIEQISSPFSEISDIPTDNESMEIMGKIMPLFSMYFLQALFNMKEEDRIIKPLAMYFE
ncbi:DUF6414 family protein [Lactobacillus bombicola]|uniref:Uncharacterized protein n=1 Tax=Lactobacillus bombicola TaxID=1505723 RepID=A0A396T2G4_9LACO|nr:hypothetical protein [Lactobacillus bombicola]RHW52651.1 hypothetical protein DS835_08040 [Lactobacillus bombicola]